MVRNSYIAKSCANTRVATDLYNAKNETAVSIQITEQAMRHWQAYAMLHPKQQVAAALVGIKSTSLNNRKHILCVFDVFPGNYLISQEKSVGLTSDTFAYWYSLLEKRYPNNSAHILGWGRTQLCLKPSLSPADVIVHHAAFSGAEYLIALITDPYKPMSESKIFGWSIGQKDIRDTFFAFPQWANEFGNLST